MHLGQYVWGLGCFLESSEPAGHLETQGQGSMVWTSGSQIGAIPAMSGDTIWWLQLGVEARDASWDAQGSPHNRGTPLHMSVCHAFLT